MEEEINNRIYYSYDILVMQWSILIDSNSQNITTGVVGSVSEKTIPGQLSF